MIFGSTMRAKNKEKCSHKIFPKFFPIFGGKLRFEVSP